MTAALPAFPIGANVDLQRVFDSPAGPEPAPADPPRPDLAAPIPRPRAEPRPVDKLSEREQQILAFERKWWRHAGSKEQAIREQFDLSATRYYQMLNRLLDLPEALEFDPVTVGRLRRLRATRARGRSTR